MQNAQIFFWIIIAKPSKCFEVVIFKSFPLTHLILIGIVFYETCCVQSASCAMENIKWVTGVRKLWPNIIATRLSKFREKFYNAYMKIYWISKTHI